VACFWLCAGKVAGISAAPGLISGDEQAILNAAILLLFRRRESEFTILLPSGGTKTCLHARQCPHHRTNEVANFVIGPIAVADITLASCA